MSDLSPAAQAVLDAVSDKYRTFVFIEYDDENPFALKNPASKIAAAALRALAHHWRKENSDEYRTPFIQGMDSCAEEADEIATELEAL